VLGLLYAVKSGVDVGPLPTAIADDQEDLVRVLGPIPELARSWRLLTPSRSAAYAARGGILRFHHRGA
jgi:hypothetical protein